MSMKYKINWLTLMRVNWEKEFIEEYRFNFMKRCAYLTMGGITITSLAGCSTESTPDDESSTDTPTETPSDTDTPSVQETFDPTEHVDDWQDERVRGEADSLSTEGTVDSDSVMEVKCGRVGRDALQSNIEDQLGQIGAIEYSFGQDSEDEHEYILTVIRRLVVKRDGSVQGKPEVSFDILHSATPRTVTATARYDETKYTCQHPEFVQDSVIFQH